MPTERVPQVADVRNDRERHISRRKETRGALARCAEEEDMHAGRELVFKFSVDAAQSSEECMQQ